MIQLTRVRTLVTVLTALILAMALVALAPPARADVGVPDEVGLFDPAMSRSRIGGDARSDLASSRFGLRPFRWE